ncbi:formylglycine-generating enzyme family protein [Cryomorpha ignava]|nr:formylglycine-generating enzyme family protein [Cryomorpha ignava]
MFYKLILSITLCFASLMVMGQFENMAVIKGGSYTPFYGTDSSRVVLNDFALDTYPITNAEYEDFLGKYPEWNKHRVIALYADGNYLIQFDENGNLLPGENPKAAATSVSWFAARKYCECNGKRLPTLDEWEYVAMADETTADARTKTTFNEFILSWYEKPKTSSQSIGTTFKNYWGVYDMHGLVWEWTLDFNSVLISGESRKDTKKDNNLFCGSAAIGASDLMNYAAFMRYAFRGSIKAKYAVRNLGFRCAKDIPAN